ncbi:hypothetical protein [Paraconexibacter sp.]|uniref:hypothetical protein n=1 Tax=Paraconexibacter sp. TaxID=2949640 RepID=UPI003564DEAD
MTSLLASRSCWYRGAGVLCCAVALAATLPALASAQATRTWVSGVGDDANPCSRTAPCKTFAGAISKTAAKGEINTLDPGGFGAVTITKSITIRSMHNAGVLAAGVSGITVNAAPTDRVILAGLDIEGAGTGVAGVRVLAGRDVRIYRSSISGFTRGGVEFTPSTGTNSNPSRLLVQDTDLTNSGTASPGVEPNAVLVQPTSSGVARATVLRSSIGGYFNGIVTRGSGRVLVSRSTITDSDNVAVFASGSSAQVRLFGNEITSNAIGLLTLNSGSILSYGNNIIDGNTTDGNPTGTISPR